MVILIFMKPTFTRNQTWLVVRNMNFIFHILGIPADEIRFFRGAGSTTNQISIRNINNIYSIYIYSDPIYIYNYIYNIIKKYRYLLYRNIDIYYIEIYIYIYITYIVIPTIVLPFVYSPIGNPPETRGPPRSWKWPWLVGQAKGFKHQGTFMDFFWNLMDFH